MGYLELAKRIETEEKATTATHPVPHETLETIFQETLNDLNRRTLDGLLGEADPSKLFRVQEAQARMDQVWKECLEGKAGLENFRQVVKQWHGAVIALFTSPQAQGTLSQERLL